jgi:hypothetical protein
MLRALPRTIDRTSARCRHASLEPAKWIAILSMTVDHYGKIFDPPWYTATHIAGRLAFPLFCWIIATRLVITPQLSMTYLRRLLPWALVSQPVWVLVGHDWWHGNILLTLALGVGLHQAIHAPPGAGRVTRVTLSGLLVLPSPWVDFGPFGVASVPLIAAIAARNRVTSAWASGPVGVLSNVGHALPLLKLPDAFALLASPVAVLSLGLGWRLPRLPTAVFYAYYPTHLLVLHLIEISSH